MKYFLSTLRLYFSVKKNVSKFEIFRKKCDTLELKFLRFFSYSVATYEIKKKNNYLSVYFFIVNKLNNLQ